MFVELCFNIAQFSGCFSHFYSCPDCKENTTIYRQAVEFNARREYVSTERQA